jgi:hypothetical protein
VAQKLHDTYGYSYDTLKVLQGGWNTWKQMNSTDPKGYPIETGNNGTPVIDNTKSDTGSQPVATKAVATP